MSPRSDLRIDGIKRGAAIFILVNGREVEAYQGETVLAALLAAGQWQLKKSNVIHQERGPWCGMGVCYECLVTINGVAKQRACMTEVCDRMEVRTHE